MSILISSSANYKMMGEAIISRESIKRAIRGLPAFAYDFEYIRDDYDRPPYWAKIQIIRRLLESHAYVLCIDADAVMLRPPTQAETWELLGDYTLAITRDEGHANTGVMCWRQCPEAFAALDRVYAGYKDPKYAATPWNEQGVLNSFINELNVHYLDRSTWNAFEHNAGPHTLIRHWANVPNRRQLMTLWQESSSRQPSTGN